MKNNDDFKNLDSSLNKFDIDINYKSVCENLIRGNVDSALCEFSRITYEYKNSNNLIIYRIFLNSLNYALYYYILFTYDIALNRCCNHSTILMHKYINRDNFTETAKIILKEYYDELIANGLVASNPFLKAVFIYVEENLDKSISLENAANHVHVNKSYLSQLFKNKTGYTFSSYVNNRKLNKARELLINTNKSILEISEECGYKSPTYFSSIFTKKTGFSPINFRKNSGEFKVKK